MNKGRLEAFSDGVFSIVVTLLIFEMKFPSLPPGDHLTDAELWNALGVLWPEVLLFFLTFAVLSVLWINHHYLFHSFAKSVDRRLNLLNLSYLAFVAFVPFTASLIGLYPMHQPAALFYGANILIIVLLSSSMMAYMRRHKGQLLNDHVTPRLINQASFRARLSMISYAVGLACSFVYVPLALFFFAFPILFNIIPGSLDLAERLFGLNLD